ncbi:GNAT family N-acetyltransferase [Chloroflexota bacterium]
MSVASQAWSVQVVTSLDGLHALAPVWQDLWQRCEGNRTPFLDFDWARLWSEHYELDGLLRILVVSRNSHVSGIVPLVVHRYAVGLLGLNVVETLAVQSRNLVGLVEPGAEEDVARAVAAFIDENMLSQGASLRLSLVPAESSFVDALMGALSSRGHNGSMNTEIISRAPYVPLPVSWDDYRRAMSHRRRKVLRRAARALETEHDVAFKECSEKEIPWAMETLYNLHQRRWQGIGMRGLFADVRAREFHTAVAQAHAGSGLIRVSVMLVDEKPASSHFIGVLDRVAYLMRSGRDESLSRYSVGHLHDINLFQRAIHEGLREADFLRGAEPYKFYWTQRYRIYNDTLVAGRIASRAVPVSFVRLWLRAAQFLEHRHTIRELVGILRVRRFEARERKRMQLDF